MPPISALLHRFSPPNPKYVDVYDGPKIEFVVMSLHKPAEVPREIAKQLATQLHIGDVHYLKKHVFVIGVLRTADDGCPNAELKFAPNKLDDSWSD